MNWLLTGRWSNTPREERICHLCNVGLGTEFHFLFECTSADVQRLRCKCIDLNIFIDELHIFHVFFFRKRINISVTLVSESYVIMYCEKKCNV
jgi:hypothetical protein